MNLKKIIAGVLLTLSTVACQSQPYVTAGRLDKGMVYVLPGIEGRSPLNESIRNGIVEGNVPYAVKIYSWGSWLGPFYNLRAQDRNYKKAGEIAIAIEEYQKQFPGRPVFLIGQSGGGAMAVWAAEQLAPGHKVNGLILINAALSREYDLTLALKNSKLGIVNLYSDGDWFFLKAGTTLLGTMDGLHETSAGKEGFIIPIDIPQIYNSLFQIYWTEEMVSSGHYGGHLSSSSQDFIKKFVAPLILAKHWTPAFINMVQRQELKKDLDIKNPNRNKPRPKKKFNPADYPKKADKKSQLNSTSPTKNSINQPPNNTNNNKHVPKSAEDLLSKKNPNFHFFHYFF